MPRFGCPFWLSFEKRSELKRKPYDTPSTRTHSFHRVFDLGTFFSWRGLILLLLFSLTIVAVQLLPENHFISIVNRFLFIICLLRSLTPLVFFILSLENCLESLFSFLLLCFVFIVFFYDRHLLCPYLLFSYFLHHEPSRAPILPP